MRQVTHALLTRPPLDRISASTDLLSFDLHVLSTPPAFILSQDQTLIKNLSRVQIWLWSLSIPFTVLGLYQTCVCYVLFEILYLEFQGCHVVNFSRFFVFACTSKLNGEGGIWTLAPLLTTYSLSRGAPSTAWVLLLVSSAWTFHLCLLKSQRRERDSNPRALSDKRFSRPPRYDHFDISPSSCLSLLLTGDLYILALLFFYVNTFFQIISFFCDWYFQVLFYPCFCRNSCPIRISSGVVIFIFV